MLSALYNYLEALRISSRLRLWRYWILPGLVAVFIAMVILGVGFTLHDNAGNWLADKYPFDFARGVVRAAAPWLSLVLIILLGVILLKHLIMVLTAPFMSLLSEKVEAAFDPYYQEKPFTVVRMLNEMMRGLRLALRNLIRELFFVLILTLLGLLGPVGIISTILIVGVQAYYAGFGNLDFTLERHFGVRDSVQFVRSNKWMAIGNGLPFLFLLTTVVGILVAPAWSTIAGTLSVLEEKERITNL